MDTLMDNIMHIAEIRWVDISVYYIYLCRLTLDFNMCIYMDKTDNYMDMQVVSTWIYHMDIYAYLEWRSHLDIHRNAKWRMSMYGYLVTLMDNIMDNAQI
jgi:hypothetical protein